MNSTQQCFAATGKILKNLPQSWVELTTHRLDIYDEEQAKSQFLEKLREQLSTDDLSAATLEALPTAYDYIRLGHQLSSILEWVLAEINGVPCEQVITFTSKTMPVLAILRNNTLSGRPTYIYYNCAEKPLTDIPRLAEIYGYKVDLRKIDNANQIAQHADGTVLYVTQTDYKQPLSSLAKSVAKVDATVNIHPHYGSAIVIHNGDKAQSVKDNLVGEVQHVRRRETIAMTPLNALHLLNEIVSNENTVAEQCTIEALNSIFDCIKNNTGTSLTPLIGSSGLSIQYAIMMGLIENALKQYPDKSIKIILPPNCYGGTNDQCRRIADLVAAVGIVDLLVDGGQDLVTSLNVALQEVADNDYVPIVLAEIPTNPRVEVPDMPQLGKVLSEQRMTQDNQLAVKPVFIVDQTFCPQVKLLDQQSQLAAVETISFSSGSKFPSGGRCIAGYCAANNAAEALMELISKHLELSDNSAVAHQLNTLAENMPSMPERIEKAYRNARQFVDYIQQTLPKSKMFFVSDAIAAQGFTPSVFSLDLPTAGETQAEREENQKRLNKRLIQFMIKAHPNECKNCVSYGQLKGSYWTIPATSTQGTTKETDKDYVVRVALSPESNVVKLSKSFSEFCRQENLI